MCEDACLNIVVKPSVTFRINVRYCLKFCVFYLRDTLLGNSTLESDAMEDPCKQFHSAVHFERVPN